MLAKASKLNYAKIVVSTRTTAMRPLRDLLARLPLLPTNSTQQIDFPAADARLLVAIRDDAETTIKVIHRGISVIGDLLSQSAVPIEDGTISSDAVESLGFLLSELGDGAAALMTLAAQCRHETSDWIGP